MAQNKTNPLPENISAKERYSKLESDRRPFVDRARQCAALTIPSIMPPQGFSETSQLPTPYQSLGARGARTLASKLLLSLFPSIPFFNYRISDQALLELGERRGEVEQQLASRERAVTSELESSAFRPSAFQALLHLIVTGNILLHIPRDPEVKARAFRLDSYVVRRDDTGAPLEIIFKETADFSALPEDVQKSLLAEPQFADYAGLDLQDKPVELYTMLYLHEGMWYEFQEADGVRIPGTEGMHKPADIEYLPLGLIFQPGEDYGRSYCEEYLGDLDSLEALSETMVEASAASARVVFMVRPGGATAVRVVAKAKNGDVISGNAEDVGAMQVQKQADLSVAKAQAEEIATRLSYAFLLHAAIQRNAERVTAQEIRYMAAELDDALGGIYTLLAVEFQLPVVKIFERRMEKRLGANKLPEDIVKPVIVAGLEAIGRGHDQQNLRAFAQEIIQVLTPEVAQMYIDFGEYIRRAAASYSIDPNGLVKSEEEIQQQQQQQQLQAMLQHLGPDLIAQLGGGAQQALQAQLQGGGGANPLEGQPPPQEG